MADADCECSGAGVGTVLYSGVGNNVQSKEVREGVGESIPKAVLVVTNSSTLPLHPAVADPLSLSSLTRPSSVWLRKWFHLLALLVYLPGVALDPDFLGLMASWVAFVFAVAEVGGGGGGGTIANM